MRTVSGLRGHQPAHVRRLADLSLAPALAQPALPERRCRSASTTRSVSTTSDSGARLQHNRMAASRSEPIRQKADELLRRSSRRQAHHQGELRVGPARSPESGRRVRAAGLVLNDWQLSGVWTASTGTAYNIGYSYKTGGGNVNITGSPDYGARIRIVGDPGSGCSGDTLRQFNAAAFQGPLSNSVGLESRPTTCAAVSRACSIWRSPATSGSAAAASSSCASTCSTRRTRRSSPDATRRSIWRARPIR